MNRARNGKYTFPCPLKNQIPPRRLFDMLSPPKPLDDIQPNLMCKLHEWGVQRQMFFVPAPETLGKGQKDKYHLIAITKSFSKIFIRNLECVLTNERYKTYQTGFLFCRLGHAQGVIF